MKQIAYIGLLFIIIPFFIASFFLIDDDNNNINEKVNIESEIYVRVKRENTNKIEKVVLEKYVIGVVAGEMPITFHLEALKAQAVAARSYVLKRIEYNKNKEYDVVDSINNQVYLDEEYLKRSWKEKYNINIQKIETAVFLTKGEYIEYNGQVADALFFSTSNGYTENSVEVFGFDVPYLKSVPSSWDKDTSPVFNDNKNYKLGDFYDLLELEYKKDIKIEILKKTSTGRILELKINDHDMTGSELVSKLSLRSNDFSIEQKNDEVFIKTTGYGHGVGMSQYGALGMAEKGYTYDEILKYYYKGIIISKIKK